MEAPAFEAFAGRMASDADGALREFVRLNAFGGAHAREAVRGLTVHLSDRGPPDAPALAAALRWLRDVDLREQARGLAQPAVLVHGSGDTLVPIAAARWLAAEMRDASLVEIARCAHVPFRTHAPQFVRALESLDG